MAYNQFGSDEERQRFNEASEESVRRGGLPLNAMGRLQEQAKRMGTPAEFFSSDLSANELLLTHECGFEPVGQVMGSSVYNVGYQYLPTGSWYSMGSGELAVITQAHYDARNLAFGRLRQEAKLLKADGVVGVRFTMKGGDWAEHVIEYQAVGTAVRRTHAPPSVGLEPFVSNLSGQEHWMLRKSGYKPVGFSFGNCTWMQYPDWRANSWFNTELPGLTQALYNARTLAMERMAEETRRVGGVGVLNVEVASQVHEFDVDSGGGSSQRYYIFTFTSFGTAVAPEADVEDRQSRLVVSLSDPVIGSIHP
jgi:uncharacterized protein YbjQ (UPF0145 family)